MGQEFERAWRCLNCPEKGSGEVHVIPVADVFEHNERDCMCGPLVEPIERNDGSVGWVVTHHSLDGREREEA